MEEGRKAPLDVINDSSFDRYGRHRTDILLPYIISFTCLLRTGLWLRMFEPRYGHEPRCGHGRYRSHVVSMSHILATDGRLKKPRCSHEPHCGYGRGRSHVVVISPLVHFNSNDGLKKCILSSEIIINNSYRRLPIHASNDGTRLQSLCVRPQLTEISNSLDNDVITA